MGEQAARADPIAAHKAATVHGVSRLVPDLNDPDLMPPKLRKAHTALDRAVDRLYRPGGFASERERVEHLFGLYEKMTAPLAVKPKPKRKRRRNSP